MWCLARARGASELTRSPPAPSAAPGSPRGIALCALHRIGARRGASPGRSGGDQRGSREYQGGPREAEGPAVPAVPLLSPLLPIRGLGEWGCSGVHSPHPSPAAPYAQGCPCQHRCGGLGEKPGSGFPSVPARVAPGCFKKGKKNQSPNRKP